MKIRSPPFERRAISGVLAAVIFFAMLFTSGMGLILFTFGSYNNYDQARASAVQAQEAKGAESLLLRSCDSSSNQLPVLAPYSPLACSGRDIEVWFENTGSLQVVLQAMWILDTTNNSMIYGFGPSDSHPVTPSLPSTITSGATLACLGSPCVLDTEFVPGSDHYAIHFITGAGNQFVATYPPPPLNVIINSAASLTTQLSATSINPGQTASDTATLSGVQGGVSGTVQFYADPTNPGVCAGLPQAGPSVSTLGSGNYREPVPLTFSSSGLYYWYAAYFNATGKLQATSPCEPLIVGTPNLGLAAALSPPVIGSYPATVADTATITGGGSAIGDTVYYNIFSGSGVCTGISNTYDSKTVGAGNSVAPSKSLLLASTGAPYSFNATLYKGITRITTSPCEPLSLLRLPGGPAPSAFGLGYVSFDFNSFHVFSTQGGCSAGNAGCKLAYYNPGGITGGSRFSVSNAPLGYGGQSGVAGFSNFHALAFSANFTNVDPGQRNIVVDPVSLFFVYVLSGGGSNYRSVAWTIGNVTATGDTSAAFPKHGIALPYNVTVTLFFVVSGGSLSSVSLPVLMSGTYYLHGAIGLGCNTLNVAYGSAIKGEAPLACPTAVGQNEPLVVVYANS